MHIFAKSAAKKLFCAFLLAYQCLFLNVVLPGHTRGAVTLSGKSSVCSLADLGCPFCGHPSGRKRTPTRQDQSDCAICHLALRITFEVPFDCYLTELGLLYVAPPFLTQAPALATIASLPPCRGPPLCAFA